MSKSSSKLSVFGALLVLPITAFSGAIDSSKLTIFVEAGQSRLDANASNATVDHPNGCELNLLVCNVDVSSPTYGIGVGYDYNENFTFTIAYHDYGKTYDLYSPDSNESIIQKAKMLSASTIVKYPFASGLTPFAEFGVGYYSSEATYTGIGYYRARDEGITPIYGLGAEYALSSRWDAKLGWRRVVSMGQETGFLTTQPSIRSIDATNDFIYLSAAYRFQ